MAPLPNNGTARLFIEYSAGGQEHTAELRLQASGGTAAAIALYNVMKPLIAAFLAPSDSVQGARYSTSGSNISLPLSVTPAVGTGSGGADSDKRPAFVSFTGRTSGGRRVRFTVFSLNLDPDTAGYREDPATGVAAQILAALIDAGNGVVAIDGLSPVWNSYVNRGYNAYYQRKVRRAG